MTDRSHARRSWTRRLRVGVTAIGVSAAVIAGGCTSLSTQLGPTDLAALEKIKDREAREQSFTDNSIYRHNEPQGVRYTKGDAPGSVKRSWQSLDVILRSDQNSAAALPVRKLRTARILTALTIASTMLIIAGAAASSREGLDFKDLSGGGLMLLSGGALTVGFAIGAGITYNQSRRGYDRAVDIYNESLGMRLGVLTAEGEYKPPGGVLIDREGNVILRDQAERVFDPDAPPVTLSEGPSPPPTPAAAATGAAPAPARPTAPLRGVALMPAR